MKKGFIALLLIGVTSIASASIRISPVLTVVAPGTRDATIRITNTSEANAVDVAFEISEWDQTATDEFQLAPTNRVAMFPPVAKIKPGSTQVVRVLFRQPVPGHYRLKIKQLPDPNLSDSVQLLLNQSVPIIVASPDWKPDVRVTASEAPGGMQLTAVNHGQVFDRIIAIETGGQRHQVSRYILPGETQAFQVPISPQGPVKVILQSQESQAR